MNADINSTPVASKDNLAEKSKKTATIIVAEDDEFVRHLICDMLISHGFRVAGFPGGDSAYQAAKSLHADLIITDLIMEEGEGISTIVRIREDSDPVRIIAVSAHPKYLTYATKLGADCTMQKPIKTRDLIKNVEQLLSAEAT